MTERFDTFYKKPKTNNLWIFARGADAKEAFEWCKKNKVRIPGEVSIVSLENDSHCCYLGISYCVPDWEAIGYAIAHSLAGVFPVERTKKGFLRAESRVIERYTTR